MKSIYKITVEAWAGTHIRHAIQDTINLSIELNRNVFLNFNGTNIEVGPDSNSEALEIEFYSHRANND